MDTEKVVSGLEYTWEYIRERPNPTAPPKARAMNGIMEAIKLLKEQEPKPVELYTNAYGTKCYFCPKCKRELFHTCNLNFCERCGQAVKWDA